MQVQKNKRKRSTDEREPLSELEVEAGGTRLRYTLLAHRGCGARGGPGWVEEAGDGEARRISAGEAYAIAVGAGREAAVVISTEALIDALRASGERHRLEQADRLRLELDQGLAGERIPVGALQRATLRAIERGMPVGALAERAGIRRRDGDGDVTGYLRRVGLAAGTAGTHARTLPYAEAVRMAAALELDPVDVGV